METLTKAEFLSFLYAEKSRELENNSAPGWNKWALYCLLASTVFYIYDLIFQIGIEKINGRMVLYQFLYGMTFWLIFMHIFMLPNLRLYNPQRIRRLIDEAPLHLYIIRLVLTLIGITVLYNLRYEWFVVILCSIAALLHIVLIGYIVNNSNKLVKAGLKNQIFVNSKYDFGINFLFTLFYNPSLVANKLYVAEIFTNEFKIAIAILILIIAICILIKMQFIISNLATGLDKIIDRFIIGSINQEDAYKQYIQLMYGTEITQIIEEEAKSFSKMEEDYAIKKRELKDLETRLENKQLPFELIDTIVHEVKEYNKFIISYHKKIQKTIAKIDEIDSLGLPKNVYKDLCPIMKELNGYLNLLTELQDDIQLIQEKTIAYCQDNHCSKYGGLCFNKECKERNEESVCKQKKSH